MTVALELGMRANEALMQERQAEVELLRTSGLVSANDVERAMALQRMQGGDLVHILKLIRKLDGFTYDAAVSCRKLIAEGKLENRAMHYRSQLLQPQQSHSRGCN